MISSNEDLLVTACAASPTLVGTAKVKQVKGASLVSLLPK